VHTQYPTVRWRDSARVVAPRAQVTPRSLAADRGPRSDITKNHGAAFRPDIFQLSVNMIGGGGRSCKSPPRRCRQRADTHTQSHTSNECTRSNTRPIVCVCVCVCVCYMCTYVINRRQPQTTARTLSRESPAIRWHVDSRFTRAEIPAAKRNLCLARTRRSPALADVGGRVCVARG